MSSSMRRRLVLYRDTDIRYGLQDLSTEGGRNGRFIVRDIPIYSQRSHKNISKNTRKKTKNLLTKSMERIFRISTKRQSLNESRIRRVKRIVFLPDTRIRINTSSKSQTFPFSATVKLSTGCTGSLISKYHILTAAHCIHNGTNFINSIAALRVGLLKRNGRYRWYGVISYNIPQQWFVNQSTRYDYAVLKIHKPIKRKYFSIGVASGFQVNIHFASFPGDKKSNSMWYSSCRAKFLRHGILSRCDASKGSSGAGLYVNDSNRNRVIVGVLSRSLALRLPNKKLVYFNAGFRITRQSGKMICRWAGSPAGCMAKS